MGAKAQSPHPRAPELSGALPLWEVHSPWDQTSPRSKVAVFWSTWLLATQVRLALGWLRDKFTCRPQELGAGPGVPLHSSSLGRPSLSQVTVRSSVFPGTLHSKVTLHQPGVMDGDSSRTWGGGADSRTGGTKEWSSHEWKIFQFSLSHPLSH